MLRDWKPGFVQVGRELVRENAHRHLEPPDGVTAEQLAATINALLDRGADIRLDDMRYTRAEVDRPGAVLVHGYDYDVDRDRWTDDDEDEEQAT